MLRKDHMVFKRKWANPGLFLFIFVFSTWHKSIYFYKSIYGVLGTQTRIGSMVGADKSAELWRHPGSHGFMLGNFSSYLVEPQQYQIR